MLVLTRKAKQSIRIADGITIRVVRIKGSTVQLGIEAPKDVQIVRSELLAKTESALSVGPDFATSHTMEFPVQVESRPAVADRFESAESCPSAENHSSGPLPRSRGKSAEGVEAGADVTPAPVRRLSAELLTAV